MYLMYSIYVFTLEVVYRLKVETFGPAHANPMGLATAQVLHTWYLCDLSDLLHSNLFFFLYVWQANGAHDPYKVQYLEGTNM